MPSADRIPHPSDNVQRALSSPPRQGSRSPLRLHQNYVRDLAALGDMLLKGAPERQIVALRTQVEHDIAAGRSPESVLMERTRANLKLMDVDPLRGHPITPLQPPTP